MTTRPRTAPICSAGAGMTFLSGNLGENRCPALALHGLSHNGHSRFPLHKTLCNATTTRSKRIRTRQDNRKRPMLQLPRHRALQHRKLRAISTHILQLWHGIPRGLIPSAERSRNALVIPAHPTPPAHRCTALNVVMIACASH